MKDKLHDRNFTKNFLIGAIFILTGAPAYAAGGIFVLILWLIPAMFFAYSWPRNICVRVLICFGFWVAALILIGFRESL